MSTYYLNCHKGTSALVWQILVNATSFAQAYFIANANGYSVLSCAHVSVVSSTPTTQP